MPRLTRRQRIVLMLGPVVIGAGMLLRQEHLLGRGVLADPLQGCVMGVGIGLMIVVLVKARRPG